MAEPIEFAVVGKPIPQGSFIGRLIGGRAFAVMSNEHAVKKWRKEIAARAVGRLEEPWDCPVEVTLGFRIDRLKTMPKRRRIWPSGHGSGDIDKLTRCVLDAITKVLIVDDSRVCRLAVSKDYAAEGGEAGVWIFIRPLPELDQPWPPGPAGG